MANGNGNGNGNGGMSGNSYVVVECLLALAIFGALSFFFKPAYEFGVGLIIGAIIATLNNAAGVKSGALAGKMPEQAGDPKTGQTVSKQTDTRSVVNSDPPTDPPAPTISKPA